MSKINLAEHFKACRDINPNETLQLLRSSQSIFWSWGATAFTVITEKGYKKALRFKSNGYKHKGHVYISVNGMDLYDVLLTSTMGTIVKEIKDLYFDQLVKVIDENIEKQTNYQF
jgi:hypothetical protein